MATKYDLDVLTQNGCVDPDCKNPDCDTLALVPNCHKTQFVQALYKYGSGEVRLVCPECGKVIVHLELATP